MGIIHIALEDEHGETIEQIEGRVHLLGKLLPDDDQSSQCLNFIDPYGDTVFNGLQMRPFIAEWDQVADKAQTDEEKILVERVRQLAEKCRELHLYLKFYGD